jgi:glycerophosphoryl diester phosphodiesterase
MARLVAVGEDGRVTRIPALRTPPIGFAHRGARAHARENTIEAFRLARRLGATGLESDVWLSADGEAVLDHDGIFGSLLRFRRRSRIASVHRDELPAHMPTLAELYQVCGNDFDLSLDVKDPAAGRRAVEVALAAGDAAPARLWLCHDDHDLLVSWRDVDPRVRLVDSTRLNRIKEGPERRAATLAERGIDAINLRYSDWTGGLTTLFHRFDRYAFGWDAQYAHVIGDLIDMGIDGIFSDHVDVLMECIDGDAPREASRDEPGT